MNRTTSLFLVGLFFLSACSSGSDLYKSSYPSHLKNGSTKKTSTPSHSNKISATERSENEFQFETKESSDNQVFSGGSSIQDSTNLKDNSDQLISQGSIEANGAVLYLPAENNDFDNHVALGNNQNDCPAITDLDCQYLGDGIYMLTWSVPKIPIYTENGTLSEYRINRRTLEDPKAFVYKTPEPDCVDGTCTIIFKNLNNRTGYIWTVDTRCSRGTLTTSNSMICGPVAESKPEPITIDSTAIRIEMPSIPHKMKEKNHNAKMSFNWALLMFLGIILSFVSLIAIATEGDLASGIIAAISIAATIIGYLYSIKLGTKGVKEINQSPSKQRGKSLAVMGIIGSSIGLIITILIALIAIGTGG